MLTSGVAGVIVVMTYIVVVFSVAVQGPSLGPFARRAFAGEAYRGDVRAGRP